jgi:outer membrane protein assembly factor BamB
MMTTSPASVQGGRPLRLWPGLAAAALILLVRFVMPRVVPDSGGTAILGALAGALVVLLWWLFFSRAPWIDRLGAIAVMACALLVTSRFVHESIAGGFMGMMLYLFAVPLLCVALVAGVAAGRSLASGARRAITAGAIVLVSAAVTLVRTDGVTGSGDSEIRWRWSQTPEERLLAQAGADAHDAAAAPAAAVAADAATKAPAPVTDEASRPPVERPASAVVPAVDPRASEAPLNASRADVGPLPEWPGFRGARRDGIVRGVRIETDWARHPPVALWRQPVGPGWSSFAVSGDLVYTQEQRGEDELVSCYSLRTGKPVWTHRDRVRFWESNGGAGPRATPAVHGGRVYAFGATGIVNALDAMTGARVWSRDAAADTGKAIPDWGFASSPLVVGDLVVVAVESQLIAYDLGSGWPRWVGTPEGGGYSSPHLVTIDGVSQIVLLRGRSTTSVAPADGRVLWEHSWQPGSGILQPALAGDHDVLLTVGDGMGGVGVRRITVARGAGGWTVEERWTSRGLKPYFNDFVVHEGHAYGFDASILACIDLNDGARKWKGGRYGHGQLVLLPDQDVLLVLSEDGELALVGAAPDGFKELARVPGIEGKTWNHPVLAGDVLLVRNGEEMAAFRLAR